MDIQIDDVVVMDADDPIGLAFHEKFHGAVAKLGGQDPVRRGGRPAALDMARHGDAGVQARDLLDLFGHFLGVAHALGDDDEE